jgi:hypothetical protein
MKYKNKLIKKIKKKYGLGKLYFFQGFKIVRDKNSCLCDNYVPIVIASLKHKPANICKQRDDIIINSKLNHIELTYFLNRLSNQDRYHSHRSNYSYTGIPTARTVLLEPTNTEHGDISSLRTSYLISYLAAI